MQNLLKQKIKKADSINILFCTSLFIIILLISIDSLMPKPVESQPVIKHETPVIEELDQTTCGLDVVVCPGEEPDGKGAMIRTVTAYNVGDPNQTDSSPCIGATGEDLCEALDRGEKIVATNELPLGSQVKINGEVYTVKDRTSSRYHNRYDIAFTFDQKHEALEWGVKNLEVIPL